MPQPYSETLNPEWSKKQDFTDVVWGDEIFEVVKVGAQRLEASWENLASSWERLIDKSVQRGFLGFGEPLVQPEWLRHMIFEHEKLWPPGLTKKEKLLLRLAQAVSRYFPGEDLSLSDVLSLRSVAGKKLVAPQNSDLTLQAMQSYARIFEQKVALPMWEAFSAESKRAAPKIMQACKKVYGETCGMQEAREMFYGDMDRAWKIKTLKISHVTYKVYGLLNDYIMLEAGTPEK
jgi:hypothetical protein